MTVRLASFVDIPYEIQLKTREWRNSENVTKYFKIKHIDTETHKKWLQSLTMDNPKNIAFLIMYNEHPVGVTYFHSIDYEKKEADWGIYIYDSNLRGVGIGKNTLENCLEYARNRLTVSTVYLDVLKDNYRAISLYEKMGFVRIDSDDDVFLRYKNNLYNQGNNILDM